MVQDRLSTAEAAQQLGTTPPTVRKMLEQGEIRGTQAPWGGRFRWEVSAASVARYVKAHGTFSGRRKRETRNGLEQRFDDLTAEVALLASALGTTTPAALRDLRRERDDLRGTVATLREALALARSAAELQRKAADERALATARLLEAMSAGERAETLLRDAAAEQEEAAATALRAAHPGDLWPESEA